MPSAAPPRSVLRTRGQIKRLRLIEIQSAEKGRHVNPHCHWSAHDRRHTPLTLKTLFQISYSFEYWVDVILTKLVEVLPRTPPVAFFLVEGIGKCSQREWYLWDVIAKFNQRNSFCHYYTIATRCRQYRQLFDNREGYLRRRSQTHWYPIFAWGGDDEAMQFWFMLSPPHLSSSSTFPPLCQNMWLEESWGLDDVWGRDIIL